MSPSWHLKEVRQIEAHSCHQGVISPSQANEAYFVLSSIEMGMLGSLAAN